MFLGWLDLKFSTFSLLYLKKETNTNWHCTDMCTLSRTNRPHTPLYLAPLHYNLYCSFFPFWVQLQTYGYHRLKLTARGLVVGEISSICMFVCGGVHVCVCSFDCRCPLEKYVLKDSTLENQKAKNKGLARKYWLQHKVSKRWTVPENSIQPDNCRG